jgi:prevent-host-death family protein
MRLMTIMIIKVMKVIRDRTEHRLMVHTAHRPRPGKPRDTAQLRGKPEKVAARERLSVVELKQLLADVLNRAEYKGERVIIHRRGKDAAAIISIEDLRLLEEAEDRLDVAAARAALAESPERIPYAEVRRKLGLTHERRKQPTKAVHH